MKYSSADLTFAELIVENKKTKWQKFKRKIKLLFVRSRVYKKLKRWEKMRWKNMKVSNGKEIITLIIEQNSMILRY